ncbi:MAG: hypothetical protein NC091_14015 [Bacteroides sp.]|nr:hypothetical protein [Bacteroides sp.]
MDDSRRKPLLYLNFKSADSLYIETVSPSGREAHQISKIDDIFEHSETIKEAAKWQLSGERWKNIDE